MNDIDKSYTFQDEHNVFIVTFVVCLKYVFCAYHKVFEKYEIHLKFLKLGQKNKIKHLLYRKSIAQYVIQYIILIRQYLLS